MTSDELKAYKKEIQDEYEKCTVLTAKRDHSMKNCGKTTDREAHGGKSWINYWRAMTGEHSSTMYCSSCGKEIFVGVPTLEQFVLFNKGDDNVEKHRAHGGHVWVNAPEGASYTGGRYITPLCPECNAQRGRQIPILKGSKYCKELGAKID